MVCTAVLWLVFKNVYCKVCVICFVPAGPPTETSSRPNSYSRILHTSKYLVETIICTKWYKYVNLHIICAGFPACFSKIAAQCATAHIHIIQTTECCVLCRLLLRSSSAAIRLGSNIHISLIFIHKLIHAASILYWSHTANIFLLHVKWRVPWRQMREPRVDLGASVSILKMNFDN